ncbi:putative zinc ribbon protein [Serratia fonticola]
MQFHYKGGKHFKTCNTEIYSISRGDWSWNYNLKEDESDINNSETINTQHHRTTSNPF